MNPFRIIGALILTVELFPYTFPHCSVRLPVRIVQSAIYSFPHGKSGQFNHGQSIPISASFLAVFLSEFAAHPNLVYDDGNSLLHEAIQKELFCFPHTSFNIRLKDIYSFSEGISKIISGYGKVSSFNKLAGQSALATTDIPNQDDHELVTLKTGST
jgi:hypothetical protein